MGSNYKKPEVENVKIQSVKESVHQTHCSGRN